MNTLPDSSGAIKKQRSAGPLSASELEVCRRKGVRLAYDPVAVGWVNSLCIDDLAGTLLPASELRGAGSVEKFSCDALRALKYISFRAWSPEDVDVYVDLLDDPDVWEQLPEPYPAPLSREQALQLIEIANTVSTHRVRALNYQGDIVGQLRLQFHTGMSFLDPAVRQAELSYWLGKAWWGKGIATDAVRLFTALSFRELELDSIFAWAYESNVASL
ncbi:MAG: GNAT family N-acetyltransferase, partial [Gammaproteobacteria bacterium]|nr:GNAT family N-acetyltransferase [Gammaproteobacteria bacterium]